MYRLLLTGSARKDLDRLRGATWERVRDAILGLKEEPRPPCCRKLRGGPNTFRIRIGDYLSVYDIDEQSRSVNLLRVKHRRDSHRGL